MKTILGCITALLIMSNVQAQFKKEHKLDLIIEDVRKTQGTLNIAFYQKDNDFLDDEDVYTAIRIKAEAPETKASVTLPAGRYAIAVYQDLDGNDKMEKNFLGIPQEPVGLSRDAIKGMSRPVFEDAAFDLPENSQVKIDLKHY